MIMADIDMPTSCYECPFCNCMALGKAGCPAKNNQWVPLFEKDDRSEECPLIDCSEELIRSAV